MDWSKQGILLNRSSGGSVAGEGALLAYRPWLSFRFGEYSGAQDDAYAGEAVDHTVLTLGGTLNEGPLVACRGSFVGTANVYRRNYTWVT